uniref:TF-B3 domain-containing protein n=2 Tax=Solanum tuberosum TaxID=4113 RepID=M1DAC2_SOLTU
MAASKHESGEVSKAQPKFYKIIVSPQCTSLRIPEDFANRYCKNLAYLEVPSGKVWEVEVVHFEDQICLDKGWLDFVDYHSISCGHFSMFGYDGCSHFNVTIFDLSATEIEYPPTKNDSDNSIEIDPENHIGHCSFGHASKRKCRDRVEEDDISFGNQNNVIEEKESQEEHEQQSEIVPSKNEAEERGEIAINYQTPKLLEVYPESHRGKTKVSDVVERSVENIGRSFVQASKRKRQDGGVEEDDDVSVDIQNNVIEEKESQGENEQQSEVERDEEMALNYQKAKAFKSNNPFIISIMHPSYVSHSFSLSIPKKFAKRYFLNHRNVVLSVTGKGSWSVKCTIGTKNAKFSWKALVLDNKLKTGDVCVFKVIEGTMPVSINVIIFPAVFNTSKHAEVVSDSEDPCSQYISADYQRAKAFTSENPFFIRVMQSSYVSGNSLNIPRVIGWEIFSAKRSDLVLQVPSKRSWTLKCNRAKEYAKLTLGWKEFVFDNNIKVGDVCVFEQVNRSNLLFNVYIFPAEENV